MLNKNKGMKKGNSVTAFEKSFINPQKKVNPVIKVGSITLYATVVVCLVVCLIMAVLDKTGVAPTVPPEPNQLPEATEPVDVSAYPESLQKLYNENFEASDFVVSYFKEKDKNKEVSLKGYKKSEEVPLFIKWDKQWGYRQYGDDFAGVNADAPMCIAMVGYHLTKDEKFSPDKVIAFAQENGYYRKGKGSVFMTEGAAKLGLSSQKITISSENIIASLQQGKPLICYMNAGTFTAKAHFVVIRAYGDGYIMINDPDSIVNSQKQWQFNDIASQMKAVWSFSPSVQ